MVLGEATPVGVLYPAVAEAACRAGAEAIGLIDLGSASGVNLQLDRVGITYANGLRLGDPAATVQVSVSVVGDRPVPSRVLPEVLARSRVDLDELDSLPDAVAQVPADVLPVVTTTWALSRLSLEDRLRFLQHLDAAATVRTVAWVSVEGVGVAPAVPTMGDRYASGHSVVGVVLLEHAALRAEAVGRCWSRGRFLSWLAGD